MILANDVSYKHFLFTSTVIPLLLFSQASFNFPFIFVYIFANSELLVLDSANK